MSTGPTEETAAEPIPAWPGSQVAPHEHGAWVDPVPGDRTVVADGPPFDGSAPDGHPDAVEDYHHLGPGVDRPRIARRRRSWVRRVLLAVLASAVIVVVVGVGALVWANGHLGGQGGSEVDVSLPEQAGHATLTAKLTSAGVVADGWLFRRYLDYRNVPAAAAGNYAFHRHEGYRAALHDLDRGPKVVQTRLTIPEGYDLNQIADRVGQLPGLSAAKFLQLAQSGAVRSPYQPAGVNSLEGLLFPDTYFVTPGEDETAVLSAMVARFDEVAAAEGLSSSASMNGLTPFQTITLASLIEKEAKLEVDRPMIARVVLNRIAKGMKLQIDATVLYAEGVHKDRILNSDLATDSPYNTYRVAGLPPGPIAGAGQASLDAALHPAAGTWLYYVLTDASGKHSFATTAAEFEHLKAEAKAKGLL